MTAFILIVLCALLFNMACVMLQLANGPRYKIPKGLLVGAIVSTITVIFAYIRVFPQ